MSVKYPLTPGHEISGVVDRLGEQVEGFSKNEKVVVYPWIGEGLCPACRIGEENLCDKPRSLGVYNDGGYAHMYWYLADSRTELRHLEGSFYISEAEYLAPTIFHEEGKAASQMIYANVRELVDTLWNKSIPSQEKIKEIEDGIQPPYIETIRDPYQIQAPPGNVFGHDSEMSR